MLHNTYSTFRHFGKYAYENIKHFPSSIVSNAVFCSQLLDRYRVFLLLPATTVYSSRRGVNFPGALSLCCCSTGECTIVDGGLQSPLLASGTEASKVTVLREIRS
jgi:hypothetical protein